MLFLDCLYILCADYYKKREKNIFKVSGLILLAAVLLMNLLLISYLIYQINIENIRGDFIEGITLISIGGYLLLLLPLLYLRYFKFTSYDEVNAKLYQLSEEKRFMYRLLSSLYIILSFLSTLGYAFYKGGIVRGWW